MKKYKDLAEFLGDLDADKLNQVNTLRKVILETEPALIENLKWNAPNYVHKGEDRITFNLANKERRVKIILHMGATKVEDRKAKPVLEDDGGLVEWNSNIRGTITFADQSDVMIKKEALKSVIKKWLKK